MATELASAAPLVATEEPVRRRVLHDVGRMSGATLVSGIGGMLNFYAAALLLGPFAWGVWQGGSLALKYGQLSHLGVVDAMSREVPLQQGRGDALAAREALDTAFSFTVVAALASAAVVAVGALALPAGDAWRLTLGFASAILAFQLAATFVETCFRAESRFDIVARMSLLRGVSAIAGIGLVVLAGLPGFLLGQLATIAGVAAYGWLRLGVRPRWSLPRARLGRMLSFGLPLTLMGLATLALATADRVLILAELDEASLALYSLSGLVFAPFAVLFSSASAVTYPRLMERYGRAGASRELLSMLTLPAERLALAVCAALGAVYVVLPFFVHALLPTFDGGVPAAKVLLFGLFAYYLFVFPTNVLLALHRQRLQLVLAAAFSVLSLALVWVGLRLGWGLEGAALGATVAYFANFAVTAACAMHLLKARPGETVAHLARALGPVAVVIAAVGVAEAFTGRLGFTAVPAAAFTLALIGLIFAFPLRAAARDLRRSLVA